MKNGDLIAITPNKTHRKIQKIKKRTEIKYVVVDIHKAAVYHSEAFFARFIIPEKVGDIIFVTQRAGWPLDYERDFSLNIYAEKVTYKNVRKENPDSTIDTAPILLYSLILKMID
jgi:hypothetical protein